MQMTSRTGDICLAERHPPWSMCGSNMVSSSF